METTEFIIRVNYGQISGVLCALVLFGLGYNTLIAEAERRGWLEGFTSLTVALGTLATLAGAAAISLPAALIVLVCFMASGLPMIGGSILRYVRRREQAQRNLADETRAHGHKPQGMAQ